MTWDLTTLRRTIDLHQLTDTKGLDLIHLGDALEISRGLNFYDNQGITMNKLTIAFGLFLAALFSQAHSATFNSLSVNTFPPPGVNDISENRSSSTGSVEFDSTPATIGSPPPASGFTNEAEVAGFADFGVLKAQTLASSNSGNFYTATSAVDTSFQVTVDAASVPSGSTTPGLSIGDSVSLSLSFRLDGRIDSAAAFGDTVGDGSLGAKLRITDSTTVGVDCLSPDGCYTPRLLDFSANASQTAFGEQNDVYVTEGWNWSLETTNRADPTSPVDPNGSTDQYVTSVQQDSYSNDYFTQGVTCLGGSTSADCSALDVAIEILSITLDTTIGATLDVSASLDAFSQALVEARSSVDFLDTYGLVLVALDERVALNYVGGITPAQFDLGGSAVPIPAAAWLFGTALIGFVGYSRRRKIG